jgi:hypothetical protein
LNSLDKHFESDQQRPPSLMAWKKGDPVYVPKVGRGVIIEVGNTLSKVKMGDMVPCLIPNSVLEEPPKKSKMPPSHAPRRQRFDYRESFGFDFS